MADYTRQGRRPRPASSRSRIGRRKAADPGPRNIEHEFEQTKGHAAARDLRKGSDESRGVAQAERHVQDQSQTGGGVPQKVVRHEELAVRALCQSPAADRSAGRPDRAVPKRASVDCRPGAGDRRLDQAINNPLYESAARKRVLQSLIAKLTFSRAMESFLVLLFEKGRFGFLGQHQRLLPEAGGRSERGWPGRR